VINTRIQSLSELNPVVAHRLLKGFSGLSRQQQTTVFLISDQWSAPCCGRSFYVLLDLLPVSGVNWLETGGKFQFHADIYKTG